MDRESVKRCCDCFPQEHIFQFDPMSAIGKIYAAAAVPCDCECHKEKEDERDDVPS